MRASALAPAFYLNCDPCRQEVIHVGVDWLRQQVRLRGGTPLIVTPVQRQAMQLQASVPGVHQIQTESQATYSKSSWPGGPLLAVWPDDRMLTNLDDDYRVTAICAVPWVLSQLMKWILARGAIDLLGTAQTQAALQLDPVVEVALESLTGAVNLGTALSHPADKSRAVSTIEALQRSGYDFKPEDILAWAMRHGWSNRGAQELAEFVRGVKDGRRFKVDRQMFRADPELIAYWKEQAEKTKSG